MKTLSTTLTALLVSLTFLAASQARAQSTVTLGTLTCTGGEGIGLVVGSNKSYACQFLPTDGEKAQTYEANVTKIGLDIGITGTSTIVWSVLSTSLDTHKGMLAGTYSGATADASIVYGGGAKILVGGGQGSVALQPLSVQGQTGVNLAVGVAAMTLNPDQELAFDELGPEGNFATRQ